MQKNLTTIGCGQIAQQHAEHVNKLANVKAPSDIVPAKAKNTAISYMATAHFRKLI